MGWRTEFGSRYEVPLFVDWLVGKNVITDMSWHNDMSPSFGVYSEPSEVAIQLWVEHPFKTLRQMEDNRFYVTKYTKGSQEGSFQTDDLEEALEKLFIYLAEVYSSGIAGVLSWTPDADAASPWSEPKEYLEELKEEFMKKS